MSKHLIDKDKSFEIYYALGLSRSLSKLHKHLAREYPESSPSYPTLKNWAKRGTWKERCKDRDEEVTAQVQAVMTPQWAAVKITLIQTFINQINAAIKAGISPESSRDMVAVSKELRALLGEGEKVEVEFTGIEYVLTESKKEVPGTQ